MRRDDRDRGKKKRHHFVPVAYLRGFVDSDGKLNVYRKYAASKSKLKISPENIAFEKYYYSQPLPSGGRDHDTLEDKFSETETKWPKFVDDLRRNENVNDSLSYFFEFMGLQHVRVPATRDMVELTLAEHVLTFAKILEQNGELPPPPPGFPDIFENVRVSIDPHKSIHAMVDILKGLGHLFDRLGFCVFANKTEIPFTTSDNPVMWFDPSLPSDLMRPYTLRPDGPVFLYFPVSSDLAIVGTKEQKEDFARDGMLRGKTTDIEHVKRLNWLTSKFAYKAAFSASSDIEVIVEDHWEVSPTVRFDRIPGKDGILTMMNRVFSKKIEKSRWKGSR